MDRRCRWWWLLAVLILCVACASTGRPVARPRPGTSTATRTSVAATGSAGTGAARACRISNLRLTYRGGGWGGGSDFGVIVITNRGPYACRLDGGTLTIRPLDAAGQVIATEARWTNTVRVRGLTLSGHGQPPASSATPPEGDRWASVLIAGDERDHSSSPDGLCPAKDEVTPASWRVTGVVNVTVPNTDTTRLPSHSPGTPAHLYACGQPTLQLLNLGITQQP